MILNELNARHDPEHRTVVVSWARGARTLSYTVPEVLIEASGQTAATLALPHLLRDWERRYPPNTKLADEVFGASAHLREVLVPEELEALALRLHRLAERVALYARSFPE